MAPLPAKKPSGPRDYVGEELEAMKSGGAKYDSVEDLLLAAIRKLSEEEQGERLGGFERSLRGPPPGAEASLEVVLGEGDGPEALKKDRMPPECEAGECEHPEHQHEDALPEDI